MKICRESKDAFWKWKMEGKPKDSENVLFRENQRLTKKLRSIQRQLYVEQRRSLYEDIMSAHSGDRNTFYKNIKKQRLKGKNTTDKIVVDDVQLDTPDLIREGWATYFGNLAKPTESKKLSNC